MTTTHPSSPSNGAPNTPGMSNVVHRNMAGRLGAARPPQHELDDIKQDVNPQKVAEEIERAERRVRDERSA
jgi:hypothetical protein